MSRDRERRAGERREEDFASRWSRMKRSAKGDGTKRDGTNGDVARGDVARGDGARGDSGAPAAATSPEQGGPDVRSDEEVLRELGLPDPNSLKPGDDIRGFMASSVPARIRNRVLRRLWVSNPALANLDGLVDYGGDFTDAAMVPAVLQTAYKVGRGWARDAEEELKAGPAENETARNETGELYGSPGGKGESRPAPDSPAAGAEAADSSAEAERAASDASDAPADLEEAPRQVGFASRKDAPPPAPRRMRFRFSDS